MTLFGVEAMLGFNVSRSKNNLEYMMKLKSLILAALAFGVSGGAMAQAVEPVAKPAHKMAHKKAHNKAHASKHMHKAKHKKAAAQ